MSISVLFHFQLPTGATRKAVLAEPHFTKEGDGWTLDDTDGAFYWGKGKSPVVVWSPFIHFDSIGDKGLQKDLLAEVKDLARRLKATSVACAPDTTARVPAADFVPIAKLSTKKLFSAADDLMDAIPADIRRLMGGEED